MSDVLPPLPPLPPLDTIAERLPRIFPEGTENRGNLIRDLATKTIFVMFYTGSVEGHGWFRPNQVLRMNDAYAAKTSDDERAAWIKASLGKRAPGHESWYADTTREPVRDETLRYALLPLGAVVERPGIAKTSSLPRWALAADFARLFTCDENEFDRLVTEWRDAHTTQGARARIAAVHAGLSASRADEILVRLPNQRLRVLSPGMSSVIAKGVVEEFAPRYLKQPGVVWLSESSRREEAADLQLASIVRLPIAANEVLPDIVLVDLAGTDARFVFVEVVASDGPINEQRKTALSDMLREGGHDPARAAFVTAFADRTSAAYKKVVSDLAWNSFVWFQSEPAKLIALHDMEREARTLFDLVD